MTSTFLIVQLVLAVLITIVILLQKSSSMGLGAYSGSNESLFGAKGPTSFLARATFIMGILFVINTITLGYLYNQQKQKSAVDSVQINKLIPSKPTLPVANTQEANIPAAPKTK